MKTQLLILFAISSLSLGACQSNADDNKSGGDQTAQNDRRESARDNPANLQIMRAEFDEQGYSQYLGHIIGRDTRYHTVEVPKGTLLELELKADHAGTKLAIIKPRGGILWSDIISDPDESLNWSGTMPVDGKYTVEISLTGKPKNQEVASQYTLNMKKSGPEQ